MNLQALIDGFFVVRRAQLAPTTRRNYRYCADKIIAHFGPERPIAEITAAELRQWAATLADGGLSPRSVHDNLAICSAFWVFAAAELGIPNIVRDVPRPRWRPRPVDPLTEEKVKALVGAAEWAAPWSGKQGKPTRSKRPTAARDTAIILTLVDTGLRASELCALEWCDYDHVADVHPHRFRHTFAVTFLRNGGNVFEMQRILGHEGLETVKTYLQLAQNDIATAQRKHSPADGWKL